MEIKIHKNEDVKDLAGDFGATTASITEANLAVVFDLISTKFYSNPIGSICREITSNCFDAHVEANVDDPVVISMGSDIEGDYITFRDVGIGLSPKRMLKIYMRYFSSTKRKKNNEIGGFGLGSKTPLSYTDSFYITTWKNGKRYEYLYDKGKNNKPELTPLNGFEERTISGFIYHKNVDGFNLPVIPAWDVKYPTGDEEDNQKGTEVKIYIKTGKDKEIFITELKSQLSYFDNVWFENIGIENDYKIFENDLFKYRSKNRYSDELHICFGKVAYPINWKMIGLTAYGVAVGIKFDIGELMPTPSREAIQYTEESKILIKDRINQTMRFLIEQFQQENKPIDDYIEYHNLKGKRPCVTIKDEIGDIAEIYLNNIPDLIKKYRYTLFEKAPIFYKFTDPFERVFNYYKQIHYGKVTETGTYTNLLDAYLTKGSRFSVDTKFDISTLRNAYHYNIRLIKPSFSSFKNIYVKSDFVIIDKKVRDNDPFFQKELDKPYFGDGKSYFNLGLSGNTYKVYKELVKMFTERCSIDYHTVPEDWAKKWKQEQLDKNNAYRRKKENKIYAKSVVRGNSDFEISIRQIELYTGVIIYGNRDDLHKLHKANIFMKNFKSFHKPGNKGKKKIYKNPCKGKYKPFNTNYEIIVIAKQNEKYFNKLNMVHVKDLYSDNSLFRRIASAFKIKNFFKDIMLYQSHSNTMEYITDFNKINSVVAKDMFLLERWLDENLAIKNLKGNDNRTIEDEIVRVANNNNWFDPLAEEIMQRVEAYFEGAEVIKFVDLATDKALPFVLKYLREKKKGINNEYYLKYVVESKMATEGQAQIIIMFPEDKLEEEPKSLFNVLTTNQSA